MRSGGTEPIRSRAFTMEDVETIWGDAIRRD
jgi:hypothetical protein